MKDKYKESLLKYNPSNNRYYCLHLSIGEKMCMDYHKSCDHKPILKEDVKGKSPEEMLNMLRKICPYKISKNGEQNGEKLIDFLLNLDKSF